MTASRGLRCLLGLTVLLFAGTAPAGTAAADAARPASADRAPVHVDRSLAREAVQVEMEESSAPDDEPGDVRREPRGPAASRRPTDPYSTLLFGPNVRLSTNLEPAGIGESEVSMAAIGDRLVAGWNDGLTFGVQPGFVGFGYSLTGGATWQDGGSLPVAGATDIYYGDPVVAADPAGHWYIADLYRATPGERDISVNHGTFSGAAPAWDLPVVVAASALDLLDKPWIAVDPQDGTVYVAYVRFLGGGGQRIEFSRSLDHGATWSAPVTMTPATSSPMSPRLVVGPDHELYLAYYSYHSGDGLEYLQLRSSASHGQTWGPERVIAGRPYWNNYFTGPAGFNRERVVALVSVDIDRTSGPTRGRLHVVWHEMVDIYGDALGVRGGVPEVEPNDASTSATPFVPGERLDGSLASTTDQDWWSFTGVAGQTFIAQLDPANGSPCNGFLRLYAGGGAVANRCGYSHFSGGQGVVVFTLPSTGTYSLRVLNWDGVAANIGAYSVFTGLHAPVATDLARDQRDVLYTSSADGGVSWTSPTLLSDARAGFDETFPEVAVDAAGRVYVMWYDHREDAANGILTTMRVRESVDSGAHWLPSFQISDSPAVNWNLVTSNMFPNMGDYSQLVADGASVHAIWADGRDGTPDPFYARLTSPNVDVPPPAAPFALALRGSGVATDGVVRVSLTDPGNGEVRLELFDLLGRRLDARTEPGQGAPHDVDLGHGLPPGIYLVRAIAGALEATNRAVVLR